MPPRQRRIPNTCHHRTKTVFRAGANFSSLSDPQILAAWNGKAVMKAPKMIATMLTTRFMAMVRTVRTDRIQSIEFRSGSTFAPPVTGLRLAFH